MKRARGKYSRKTSFKNRVKRVLMKAAETKYIDVGENQLQLYHNVGQSTIVPIVPFVPKSVPGLFNIWSIIQPGNMRDQRIGDKVTPIGMKLQLYLAAKHDRPNTMFRVIVARLPKLQAGVITTNIFDPFQNTGTGNRMLLQADSDRGVRFLYDRIHRLPTGQYVAGTAGQAGNKEATKIVSLWIKRRKGGRDIVYNQNTQAIVNNPIAVYIIPYEQYSTFETDNIGAIDYRCRIYWKDL